MCLINTALKVSKYGVFSGPNLRKCGPEYLHHAQNHRNMETQTVSSIIRVICVNVMAEILAECPVTYCKVN